MTDKMDLATAENFLEDGAQCKYCPYKVEDGGDCGRTCDSVILLAARIVIAAREAERDDARSAIELHTKLVDEMHEKLREADEKNINLLADVIRLETERDDHKRNAEKLLEMFDREGVPTTDDLVLLKYARKMYGG